MTPQLIPLLLVPFLLAADIWAIARGGRGTTRAHRLARMTGIAALLALAVFVVALVDLLTQVWVMRPGSMSGAAYVGSGVAFVILSLVALVFAMTLRRQRASAP